MIKFDTMNYIIDFFKNADQSTHGIFQCLKSTINNLQLDSKRNSCFSADNNNYNSGIRHSLCTRILILKNNNLILKLNKLFPLCIIQQNVL